MVKDQRQRKTQFRFTHLTFIGLNQDNSSLAVVPISHYSFLSAELLSLYRKGLVWIVPDRQKLIGHIGVEASENFHLPISREYMLSPLVYNQGFPLAHHTKDRRSDPAFYLLTVILTTSVLRAFGESKKEKKKGVSRTYIQQKGGSTVG